MSEAGPYDAIGRRSSVTTWCCRRPSDVTMRAASLMMRSRRDSVASAHNGKPSFSHNNSNSSDYHEALASAGPIQWDNIFTHFGNEDGHDEQQFSREVTPGTLEAAATATSIGDGVTPGVVDTTTSDATAATTADCHPLQRPKPSRTLSSIRSIRSVGPGNPSPEELAQGLEAGEGEERVAG